MKSIEKHMCEDKDDGAYVQQRMESETWQKREEQLANYAAQKKALCVENDTISDSLFQEYGVNRGAS